MTKKCRIEGCQKTNIAADNLCWAHYQRRKRGLENWQESSTRISRYPDGAECSVDWCSRKPKGNGFCDLHYRRNQKGKDMNAPYGYRSLETCEIEGCDRKYCAKGLCSLHYQRRRLGYSMESPIRKKLLVSPDKCTVEGCGRRHNARGFCRTHYLRSRGISSIPFDTPIRERKGKSG